MSKPLFPTESCPGPSRRRALPRAALLAALCPVAALAAPPPEPLVLGERDGLEVVLFPTPRPHVLRVLPAVVVVLRSGVPVPAELATRAESLGGRSWRLPTAEPVAEAARWAAHPAVEAADPDMLVPRRRTDFDDPGYGGQWYLEKLKADALFAVSLGVPETHVVVIDSATDITHPDLVEAIAAPWDTVDEDADPSPNRGDFCPQGVNAICDEHGTAVSGIIAARANNGTGIVGLCPQCTLVPIRLISDGETPISADVRAFEHAIEQNAAVINNSWGFVEATPAPRALAAVIHRAATETRGGLGAVVVFAAGNDDRPLEDDEVTGLPDVLCVSAADSYGRPTAYTNRGASVDVAAPSATVTLAPGGGMTQTFGGTSAAAPVVSGLAAWALSVAPEMSAADLRALLVETAVQSPLITPDENGHHDVYGFGMVDPTAMLARLAPPEPDAGVPPEGDAAATLADAAPDAAPQPGDADREPSADAGMLVEPDATPSTDGGSGGGGGCQAAAGRSGAVSGFGALVLMLLAGARRARRATATTSPKRTTDSGR
jgi:serine protease